MRGAEQAVVVTVQRHVRRFADRPGIAGRQHVDVSRVVPPHGPSKRRGKKRGAAANRPVVDYTVRNVPVTLLLTRHNDESHPDRAEAKQYLALLDKLLDDFAPDQLVACNGHPMILEATRKRGITTAFAVRGFGYYAAQYFEDVDHAFTCSQFLTDLYRDKVGLVSTAIEPPVEWSNVVAPLESRAFVTFVNPSSHKGLLLFARLADMLGSRRPDIPILVVQSGHSGGSLNAIPGIDFSRYPQIMAAPPVPTPADFFALTRILVVPSVWEEPFGRVAAEAMINAISALVSNRGSLPHVVGGDFSDGGGGRVLPVPDWMTFKTTKLPSELEIEPWLRSCLYLWDDPTLYRSRAFLKFADLSRTLKLAKSGSSFRASKASELIRVRRKGFLEGWWRA